MLSFYTMFCYVTLGVLCGTLCKHCKYHASGLSGCLQGPLGTLLVLLGVPKGSLGDPWCILGFPGLSLEPLCGLPGDSPEPRWGLLVLPGDSQVTPWVLLVTSRDVPWTPGGLPGHPAEQTSGL